jgi:hypothetical protein
MPSSGTSHCVALVRTDISEECIASIIKVTRIGELRMLAVTSNQSTLLVTANVAPTSPILFTLMMDVIHSSETSVSTRTTRHYMPEDGIHHPLICLKLPHRLSGQFLAIFLPGISKGYYKKKPPWPLVRERTIPTARPPLVDEIWCQLLWIEGCHVVSAADPQRSLISVF